MTLHDNLNRENYHISQAVQNTHDQLSDIISSPIIDSMTHDVDREASKSTVKLESEQEQWAQTAADDPTEKLDLVSREEEKDCGLEEDVSTCEILNIQSEYIQIRQIF